MHCNPPKRMLIWWGMSKIWTQFKRGLKANCEKIMKNSKCIYLHPPKRMPMWWKNGIFSSMIVETYLGLCNLFVEHLQVTSHKFEYYSIWNFTLILINYYFITYF